MRREEIWVARVQSGHETIVDYLDLRALPLRAVLQLFVLQLVQLGVAPLGDGAGLGKDLDVGVVEGCLALRQLVSQVLGQQQVAYIDK